MLEYLIIGKIVKTHGIRGEVKVYPTTKDINRYDHLKWLYLEKTEQFTRYDVENVRYHKNMVILKLKGVDTREEAEKLVGGLLKVDRDHAIDLEEDEYFIGDIIDLEVYNVNGVCMGKVTDVISTGSNDVYVVNGPDGEVLIPAIKQYVKQIDIKKGMMVVEI
ncbi:16S rRNA processing protein RimM [Caldanaerobius fijiensis DSM 17918]|uniref:Ribosome maturation factor RimM n=1 Tax=Caldanaerobius fijiensis DSM 17918 TaxID=1121256 RepID=A0A1M5E7M0_9THEO|nr:ribosome maturation factor RimM [Caldanaerobius fijiensis]SHF75072.1 16S rRNA processing protein RimM [Caldanaerobius fijiensis DSM 17918]